MDAMLQPTPSHLTNYSDRRAAVRHSRQPGESTARGRPTFLCALSHGPITRAPSGPQSPPFGGSAPHAGRYPAQPPPHARREEAESNALIALLLILNLLLRSCSSCSPSVSLAQQYIN